MFVRIGEKPTDDKYTVKCELPHQDPDDVFCEAEYFRNSSRSEFRRNYFDARANEGNWRSMDNKLKYSKGKRCEAAIFKILNPYTCIIDPEKLGSYALINLKINLF